MSAGDLEFGLKNANSTPTGEERETVGGEWAESQSAIAELLGVDRKTIQRWLRKPKNPGVDPEKGYHIEKWRTFGAEVGRKTRLPDKAAAELQGILLKNERTRLENEVARGNLLGADEVAELLAGLTSAAAGKLATRNHELAPLVVGVTVPEASKRIRSGDVKVLGELSIPTWAKKKAGPAGIFWSKVSQILSDLLPTESPGDGLKSTS